MKKGQRNPPLRQVLGGFLGGGTIVDEGHEGAGHAAGVGVLDDVPTVDDAAGALP